MDIATIVGILTAFGLIVYSMGDSVMAFYDLPSIEIVIGGALGAMMVQFRFDQLVSAVKVAIKVFRYAPKDPAELIKQLVSHAHQARREGILALESAAQQAEDPFLARALQLAVDGHEVGAIEAILGTEIDQLKERHKSCTEVFTALGALGPAFGMIGTLIGLVMMLKNMNDPSTIGPSMAVALITTFYGAILANILCLPVAGKLRGRSSDEVLYKELAMNGIISISQGDNPRVVEQKLTSYLQPASRKAASSE